MSSDESGKALLARILDDPSDTNARLVYADWLLERGEPRGELIQLQCMESDPSKAQRVRGLIRRHAGRWLGPVAAVTEPADRVWDRGFLRAARLTQGHFREIREAFGHPEWATVESLDTQGHAMAGELLLAGGMRSLRTVTRLLAPFVGDLAKSVPCAIEELEVLEWPEGRLPVLERAPGLPRLRVLSVGRHTPQELEWLRSFEPKLDTLIVNTYRDPRMLDPWLVALTSADWPMSTFGIGYVQSDLRLTPTIRLQRDTERRWTRLHVSKCNQSFEVDLVVQTLRQLPAGTFRELTVSGFDEQQSEHIRRAARL